MLKKNITDIDSVYSLASFFRFITCLFICLFASAKPSKRLKRLQSVKVSRLMRACPCDGLYVLPMEIPY